jgi:uncharacterized protein (TIGR02611 family)
MSRKAAFAKHSKRIALEFLGWTLVLAGIAALVLPGPGLLAIFAGLAILSQQYEWAERRIDPVKKRALEGASDSVKTWPRIAVATTIALGIVAFGVLYVRQPAAPSWWPVSDDYWLYGSWPPGVTLILSGLFALGLIVYSYRRFHDNPYDHDHDGD